MVEIEEIILSAFPGWDDMGGCEDKRMKYGVICEHDDEIFCDCRQKYLLTLIMSRLRENGL